MQRHSYGLGMVFKRALVGIDGSPAALLALRLTGRLLVPDGRVLALTVAEVHLAAHAGMDAAVWAEQIDRDAHAASLAAERELEGAGGEARVVRGYAAHSLLATAGKIDAELIAIGSHGTSRAVGIALGSVATRVIHDAPCSVLVARGDPQFKNFPQSIVVGIDTSPEAVEAQVMAMALGAAYGARVRPLTATGGHPLPEEAALITDLDARSPVEALVDASRTNDLIVVGSRGLHGVRALGSVAERVAHQAHCPVLIVRGQTETIRSRRGSSGRPTVVV
jgi:nucleotide-binding universal stress UspA family protein